jgi:rRNA-processing protein FCF1
MKKIMFDTNIFDKLGDVISVIEGTVDKGTYEYLVTTTQIEELCNISDSKIEIRKQNFLRLAKLHAKLVSTSVSILGDAVLGSTILGVGEVYDNTLKESGENIHDSIIADTAIDNGCTLITTDKNLYNKMKSQECSVMTLKEFIDSIG